MSNEVMYGAVLAHDTCVYVCTHAIQSHKVKLTKTQRDALRAERERTRIEAKAKREAEKQLKEQEKK